MKLPASTIVESVTAMTLILIAFGLGISIFSTVLRGDAFQPKNIAYSAVQSWLTQTKNEKSFRNDSKDFLYLKLTKMVKPFEPSWQSGNLIELTISAKDAKDLPLYTHQEILAIE